jgi:brefeldin A-resistance guanine nucleotide exchange factor 1
MTILADTSHIAPARQTYPSSETFIATKNQKRILLVGAARFNVKPKDGLAYLEQHGLLKVRPGQTKAQAIATLLKTCPRLDKTLLGDYLSRPDNVEILQTFMGLFDFSDVRRSPCSAPLLRS